MSFVRSSDPNMVGLLKLERTLSEQLFVKTVLIGSQGLRQIPGGEMRQRHMCEHLCQGPFPNTLDPQDVLNLAIGATLLDACRSEGGDSLEVHEILDLPFVEKPEQFFLLRGR